MSIPQFLANSCPRTRATTRCVTGCHFCREPIFTGQKLKGFMTTLSPRLNSIMTGEQRGRSCSIGFEPLQHFVGSGTVGPIALGESCLYHLCYEHDQALAEATPD